MYVLEPSCSSGPLGNIGTIGTIGNIGNIGTIDRWVQVKFKHFKVWTFKHLIWAHGQGHLCLSVCVRGVIHD